MDQYKTLSLSKLKVNPENPRYRNPRISESDAILALFKEIKSNPETALRQMLNLIDDIANHGTNPADLPIVVPDPNDRDTYQVMEGNRRIASLKLLYFPDLATEVLQAEPRALNRLEEFRESFLNRFPEQYKEVLCVLCPTPENAHHWIYLRHTGENEGRGITPWDKAAKDHFRLHAAERKHTIATQLAEVLTREGYLKPDAPVVLSTLERMVRDPDVISQLHIEIEDDEIKLPSAPQLRVFALRVLQRIALDTADKDPQTKMKRLTSRHINQKQERTQYLSQVIAQISHPGPKHLPTEESKAPIVPQSAISASAKNGERVSSPPVPTQTPSLPLAPPVCPSRPPATQDYKKRRGVAAKGIKVQHSTLNHLYQELCQLDAESYPNVGIMGIRAFLESSLDVFIKQFASESEFDDWKHNTKAPFNITLSTKLARVTNCLTRQGTLPSDVAQAIRKYQNNQDNLLSVDTLQAYLHNPALEPRADTVKYWWDAYHSLFEALWNTYNVAKR